MTRDLDRGRPAQTPFKGNHRDPPPLRWRRFDSMTHAGKAARRRPCVYVQTDPNGHPLRVGKAARGLHHRYDEGAMDAAMDGSENLIYTARVPRHFLGRVEAQLIWEWRPRHNQLDKAVPPAMTLLLCHEGDPPNFTMTGLDSVAGAAQSWDGAVVQPPMSVSERQRQAAYKAWIRKTPKAGGATCCQEVVVGVHEWHFQKELTRQWERDGIELATGERLQLAAWELTVDWELNDPRNGNRWAKPSLDFLAVDHMGHPVALELKMRLTGHLHVWRAACQVTARALELSANATDEKLGRMRQLCHSGSNSRVASISLPAGENWPVHLHSHWRRILASPIVDDSEVRAAVGRLGDDPVAAAQKWLAESPHLCREDRHARRLADFPSTSEHVLTQGVETLLV